MAKKRKNSNYVTEKNIEKQAQRERERKNKIIKARVKIIAIITAAVLAVAGLFTGLGFAFDWFGHTPKATHHAAIEIEGYGTIHLELYGEDAPETVENFVKLANSGYYNGLDFHRIIDGFMMQGGKGAGTASIKGEFSANGFDNKIKHEPGIISMARTNEYNSASDQFFIVHEEASHLDGKYAAFGKVTDGMDIVNEICENAKPTDSNGSIAKADRPVIKSVTVHSADGHSH